MKFAVTVNDRTYSIQIPWRLLLAGLLSMVLWQPAAAWASTTFADVPTSHTFHDDIEWMATTGVTKGCNPPTNDEYCPDDFVTREQMAAFMHRFSSNVDSANGPDPQVESRLANLESAVATLQSEVDALQSEDAAQQGEIDAVEGEVDAVQSLLAGVTRSGDVLRFSGMNLQVVNGTGTTDGTPNGLGNLVIGYDTPRFSGSDKSGSHYLVVGDEHNYTAFGGLLAGFHNTASGNWASVSGGYTNIASGWYASVSGGYSNTASSGTAASVSGGYQNTASGLSASVSGGGHNIASGARASVSGGWQNTASGTNVSILGGNTKTVSATYACHPSCP